MSDYQGKTCMAPTCVSTERHTRVRFSVPGFIGAGEGFVCSQHVHLVRASMGEYLSIEPLDPR